MRVVGECKHSFGVILSSAVEPLFLAIINFTSPL